MQHQPPEGRATKLCGMCLIPGLQCFFIMQPGIDLLHQQMMYHQAIARCQEFALGPFTCEECLSFRIQQRLLHKGIKTMLWSAPTRCREEPEGCKRIRMLIHIEQHPLLRQHSLTEAVYHLLLRLIIVLSLQLLKPTVSHALRNRKKQGISDKHLQQMDTHSSDKGFRPCVQRQCIQCLFQLLRLTARQHPAGVDVKALITQRIAVDHKRLPPCRHPLTFLHQPAT